MNHRHGRHPEQGIALKRREDTKAAYSESESMRVVVFERQFGVRCPQAR